MIPNSGRVLYACIAKGTTILAEYNSESADLAALAAKCLAKTPPFHAFFSHTLRKRTHTFLIGDPFVYFGIFEHSIRTSEALSFLGRVKDAFNDLVGGDNTERLESLNTHCFQGDFDPVFHQLLGSQASLESLSSPREVLKHSRRDSLETPRGQRVGSMSFLRGETSSFFKKKKKKKLPNGNGEGNGPPSDNWVDESNSSGSGGSRSLTREFSVLMHKNGFHPVDQKAKRVWKKQVWVVLSLDLIVCCILFVVWLWICRGFKCIEG